MKRYLVLALLIFASLSAMAWGRLGHSTVAEIAERHLTPKAKANIMYYTKGEKLSKFAVFMDEVAKTPPYDHALRGWHASQADTDCTSSREYRAKCRREGRDGVTAMEDFREMLKNYKSLDDSTVLTAIKCIIHIVGDFHCPAHVRYEDKNNAGKEGIKFFGKKTTLHKVWDTSCLTRHFPKTGYLQLADQLDTYSKKEIKKVQAGWAQQWFEDAARDVRPYINRVKKGDDLNDENFEDWAWPLAVKEVQKAGYQLAKALNTIFGR